MKVNILGTEYEIKHLSETEYPKLKLSEANGIAELYTKELIINKDIDDGSGMAFENLEEYENKVIRHEIVHAFLHESGLMDYCSDEKLVDWIAIQLPKILKACQTVNCL